MATPGSGFPRSPLESVFNSFVPQGHEKALKQALYNVVSVVLVCVAISVSWAVYIILHPFIKPLLWAVLCGSVLHPFKHSIASSARKWLVNLETTSTPLIVGVMTMPFSFLNKTSDKLGDWLVQYIKPILTFALGIPILHVVYYYTPAALTSLVQRLGGIALCLIKAFVGYVNSTFALAIIVGYIIVVIFLWNKSTAVNFRFTSYVVWVVGAAYFSTIGGSFKLAFFFVIVVLFILGLVKEVSVVHKKRVEKGIGSTYTDTAATILFSPKEVNVEPSEVPSEDSVQIIEEKENDSEGITSQVPSGNENVQPPRTNLVPPTPPRTLSAARKAEAADTLNLKKPSVGSNYYLYGVLWACVVIQIWKHVWLLHLLPFPVVLYIIKKAGWYFGIWQACGAQLTALKTSVQTWVKEREDALIPPPVRGLGKLATQTDHRIRKAVEDSLDVASAMFVMLVVIIFTITASIFVSVQMYAEGTHLVQVSSNLINSTVLHNPEFQQMLPEGWENLLDTMFNNAYIYGRQGITNTIRSFLGEEDPQKSAQLELQVLELWDRVYQAWMSSNSGNTFVGPKSNEDAIFSSWESLLDGLRKTPELLNVSALISFARNNVGTLMSVLESVWSILKGNISLAIGALTALLSLLFGGGFALLNFIISLVVFLTALFYLLSAKGKLYKPVELITSFSPGSGKKFGTAVEEAVNSVFKASFKMALFYGVWTWLTHTVFQVSIVFIPSALAAVLAAVPFLGTYWAAIPAVLDLWLVQHRGTEGLLLLLVQVLPISFVDTSIYSEITGGGHPYLTGLAIAGGIFCLGVEGAIMGPLMLCCLFVAINIWSTLICESPVDQPHGLPARFLKRSSSEYASVYTYHFMP